MRILPDGLVIGQSGVVSWMEAHNDRFNLHSRTIFNVKDEEYGAVGDGVADDAAALNEAYIDAAIAGGTVVIPAGTYKYGSDLNWTSNKVSVIGAGSSAVTLQAVGTKKIIARPSPMTVTQGPRFAGFTVKGASGAPSSATGIYSGDITASQWEDVVIRGFNGTGSIGLHLANVTNWTELNHFTRIRCDDNTVGIKCSVTSPGTNSFARNHWDVHFNLHANQIGIQTANDALLYGQKGSFDGNSTGNNTVFIDLTGTSSISGNMHMDFEQTSGTGAIGVREASVGFQFFLTGVRNYAGTMPEDQGGGPDVFNAPLGIRLREGLANAKMGAATLVGGTVTVNTSSTKAATAGQRIYLTRQLGGGTRGELEIGTRTAGASFVINSVDSAGALVADTSVVGWMIVDRY